MQSAIEESLRATATETKPTAAVSKGDSTKKSTSKFGTIGVLQKDEDSSDEEGH
jgi:hypothetical protein